MRQPVKRQYGVKLSYRSGALSYLLALLMATVLSGIVMTACVHHVISVEEVDAMVKAQVPIGSDREKVNSFIETVKVGSLKIDRGPLQNAEIHLKYARTARDREKLEELGTRIAEFGGVVISDAETGFLYYAAIVITFYVDKNGKLIDYTG